MQRRWIVQALIVSLLLLAMPSLASAEQSAEQSTAPEIVDRGDDVIIRQGEISGDLDLQATDPLDLLVGVDTIRDHSLGTDVLEVWTCELGGSVNDYVAQLDAEIVPWFTHHSRGRYQPDFVARGNAGDSLGECEAYSVDNAGVDAEGGLILMPGAGGFASPGFTCGFSPCPGSHSYRDGNGRSGFIGWPDGFLATAAHELGHMLSWPHSYTGQSGDQYDNASDLMSGNYGVYSNGYGSYPEPYATSAINYYAAGWIDPDEVYVSAAGRDETVTLSTQAGDEYKMAVIRVSADRYYTLAARVPSTYDPIPDHWAGVEVYEVEKCSAGELGCSNDASMLPGFRRIKPHPAVAFDFSDRSAYDERLPHVIAPGTSRSVAGVTVTVGNIDGQSIAVSFDPPNFVDTGGSVFVDDIEWLAASGITRGCNPPVNNLFCPDESVTRGQMAAFLHRALPDLATSGSTDFSDDNGSTFEDDIEWLAATGVTRGCNPPANDRFCPDEPVTRGAMAAFLHRALGG